MTVIFKDLINEKLNIVFKFVKQNRIFVKFISFALVAVFSLVVSIVSCGITFGFNVNYSGKNIAVVSKTSVFEKAKELVLENVQDRKAANVIEKPEFNFTITITDKLDNESKLADAIIENTEEISSGYAIKVNGEVLTYTNIKEITDYIEKARCRYFVDGAENKSTFVDNIEIEEGYYLNSKIEDINTVKSKINTLAVKTVVTLTSESEINFSTQTVKNNNQNVNYTKVVTKGVNGLSRKVEAVETINGVETSRTEVSNDVITQPVTQVVEKGTKAVYASGTQRANVASSGFICPMNKSDIKMISAYWGDGRGHKAVDLAGDTGTAIFASKAGTVTFSGYDGAYGYCVVVDHGDGYKTRYAHASALCVKKGDTVTQGQQVAKLGNTGRSTGPHLHFEIIKNGTRVNPTNYVNFK